LRVDGTRPFVGLPNACANPLAQLSHATQILDDLLPFVEAERFRHVAIGRELRELALHDAQEQIHANRDRCLRVLRQTQCTSPSRRAGEVACAAIGKPEGRISNEKSGGFKRSKRSGPRRLRLAELAFRVPVVCGVENPAGALCPVLCPPEIVRR
jgi:hypothetical protein